jgi:Tfp pilus assembly protein PilV
MRQSTRAGFTLVEVLVAILLIDVGVLAMVSGLAVVARREMGMRSRVAAARAAENRIQSLLAGPCAPARGSASGERGLTEWWSVQLVAGRQRDLQDSVQFFVDGVRHHTVVRTRAPC